MTADAIAKVVTDLRLGRADVERAPQGRSVQGSDLFLDVKRKALVVDITPLYQDWHTGGRAWGVYEDSVCRPPWANALVGYVNDHGNVVLMHTIALPIEDNPPRWESRATDHAIDWDEIGWVIGVEVWLGGWSDTSHRPIPTTHAGHLFKLAVARDGTLVDLSWTDDRHDNEADILQHWGNTQTALLMALTFLNCRNVTIVTPHRPRAQQRRLARWNVDVGELQVFALGKTVQGTRPAPGTGVPLTSVRGHPARYGPEHGRGLLFGKYSGIFWIPQHARGKAELGERTPSYALRPETS